MEVLLFGASGHLAKEIARKLKQQGYTFMVVVRNKNKAEELSIFTSNHVIADVTNSNVLKDICRGYDVVISALGKSVSPNDKSKSTFYQVDLEANSRILAEAINSGVKKIVYISALHSEKYPHLEYFRVHHAFSEKLKASGINYSIIKPPALYIAFLDVIAMARKGQLVTLGKGDKKTNPIYEGDLAKICVDSIKESNVVIEAGGSETYTRKEINELIQRYAAPGKKVRSVLLFLVKVGLPLIKLFDKNAFDKFAFYTAVMQHDTLAPAKGQMKLGQYIERRINE